MLGQFRVVNRHASDINQFMVLSKGESISWEPRPTQWAGWLWGANETGCAGWIPEAWMTVDGTRAIMTQDYNATELTVNEGELLQGELVESGWLLAKDKNGRLGWVPLDCVEPLF